MADAAIKKPRRVLTPEQEIAALRRERASLRNQIADQGRSIRDLERYLTDIEKANHLLTRLCKAQAEAIADQVVPLKTLRDLEIPF